MSLGALNLSLLPPSLADSAMLALLSSDGQVYAACATCGWEHRIDLIGKIGPAAVGGAVAAAACAHCGAAKSLRLVRHALLVTFDCEDCGATPCIDVGADAQVVCPRCMSQRLAPVDEVLTPPYPAEFDEMEPPAWSLRASERHAWGKSGTADATMIHRMAEAATILPQHHRYHYLLIIFARRLRITSRYDLEGEYVMVNIAANLEQGYLRATGNALMGAQALEDFREMIRLAPDALNRAIAEHSFAMGAFSMLSRWQQAYVDAVTGYDRIEGIQGLRAFALGAAGDAQQVLAEHQSPGDDQMAAQLARVQYVIGDLLRLGDDDDERRTALEFFAAAESDPWTAEHLGFAIAESRGHTIMELADPTDEEAAQAAEDLRRAASATGSDSAYQNRWLSRYLFSKLVMRYSQDRHAGLAELEQASAEALQQFSAFGDEMQLLYQAERISEVFELLAFRYADFGWCDEALSALETTRGNAVRRYSMSAEEMELMQHELQARQMEDLQPAALKDVGFPSLGPVASERSIEDYFEENPIGPPTKQLLRGRGDVPTAVLCLWVTELHPGDPVVAALVCHMIDEDAWVNKRHMWRPEPGDLDFLNSGRWVQPGPFRERLLESACRRGFEALIAPVAPLLAETGTKRLVLSLPGRMSRLPVAAFVDADGIRFGADWSITCLPSVRFGADLVGRAGPTGVGLHGGAQAAARVLALGYGGDDMREQQAELDDLASIWGDRITIIEGRDCTKPAVLEALNGEWDIIHIACHGTFYEAVPMRSALHFVADPDDDARRVTADDLLRHVVCPAGPLVILSACSSVLTADSKSNSFHGLAGSLFRIGAQAIIGSRWPVADEAARRAMVELHTSLQDGGPADLALTNATAVMRDAGRPVQDWAAFGYYGVA